MKSKFLQLSALLSVVSVSVCAQDFKLQSPSHPDSLKTYKLDEIVITSTRATEPLL